MKSNLQLALEDLKSAYLLYKEALYNTSGFHSQQCVEKALKFVLEKHDVYVRNQHDVRFLLDTLKSYEATYFEFDSDVDMLQMVYTASRYADVYRELGEKEALELYTAAKKIYDFIYKKHAT
ncbi:MAG: HEPN domain-containing protein [Ruminiclostridium sp.]|nr:HEPN domain-containing protein [Ruminiclostridium sp.]